MKINHITAYPTKPRMFSKGTSPHEQRVITLVTDIVDTDEVSYLKIGYAIKHPNDIFKKKVGVEHATQHMKNSSMFVLPDGFDSYVDIQIYSLMILSYLINKDQTIKSEELRDSLIAMVYQRIRKVEPYTSGVADKLSYDLSWAIEYFSEHTPKDYPQLYALSMGSWWKEYKLMTNCFNTSPDFSAIEFLQH